MGLPGSDDGHESYFSGLYYTHMSAISLQGRFFNSNLMMTFRYPNNDLKVTGWWKRIYKSIREGVNSGAVFVFCWCVILVVFNKQTTIDNTEILYMRDDQAYFNSALGFKDSIYTHGVRDNGMVFLNNIGLSSRLLLSQLSYFKFCFCIFETAFMHVFEGMFVGFDV